MKRKLTGMLGALLSAGMVVAMAVPAAAQTTGEETFDGVIVTSGVSGERVVVNSIVVAKGVFDGVGRVNAQGQLEPDRAVLWPFTVRACDNGLLGGDWYELEVWKQDFEPHYDARAFLTSGDILKARF